MDVTYSRGERAADSLIHVIGVLGAVAAVAALFGLALPEPRGTVVASLAVYSAGLLTMLAASAGYNMVRREGIKRILRRLDHAAIFVMIAGTYTPFATIAMARPEGLWLLAGVWTAGLVGIMLVLGWPDRLEGAKIALYLVQGWAVLLVLKPLIATVSQQVLTLLLAGGLIYTLGVAFHLWRRLPYHNVIWHALVLLAAACHYWAILSLLDLA